MTPRTTYTTLISPATLVKHLDDPDWLIFDVRHDLADPAWGRRAYETAHLPGALFMSLDVDLSAAANGRNGRHPLPPAERFVKRLSQLGVTAGRQVVAYDQAQGIFAARLWWMLRWLGFDACAVLDGGLARWQLEGLSTSSAVCSARPAPFVPQSRALAVDVTGVEASLERGTMTLIDARAASRFRGENETLDPVGGHIPGALNRPFTENMTADNTFKSATQLCAEFGTLLKNAPASSVVHQCGSGITACHNALAMEVAGLHGARLYPGSWSEWCSDPVRPVMR